MQRDYMVVTQHQDAPGDLASDKYVTVQDYQGLSSALRDAVESRTEQILMRAYSYHRDLNEDLAKVTSLFTSTDPLGVFAIDKLTYEQTKLVSFTEIEFTITYKCSKEQLDSIVDIDGRTAFKNRMFPALRDFQPEIIVHTQTYDDNDYSAVQLVPELYYANPDLAFGMPVVSEAFYPSAGDDRIIRIIFSYPQDRETMIAQRTEAIKVANAVAAQASGLEPPKCALLLYDMLANHTTFDSAAYARLIAESNGFIKGEESTVYGALVKQLALSEGFSLSYKKFCDINGISCLVVTGTLDGVEHYWNLISLDGKWYHVDVSRAGFADEASHDFFLMSDATIPSGYSWEQSAYPKCESNEYSYESIAGTSAG